MEVVTPFGWVPTPVGRAGRRASKRPVVFTVSTEVRRLWAGRGKMRQTLVSGRYGEGGMGFTGCAVVVGSSWRTTATRTSCLAL